MTPDASLLHNLWPLDKPTHAWLWDSWLIPVAAKGDVHSSIYINRSSSSCRYRDLPFTLSWLQHCHKGLQDDLGKECAVKSGLCRLAAREPEGLSFLPDKKRVLDLVVHTTNIIHEHRPFGHNLACLPKLNHICGL